jgi:hypothetical protein
MLVSPNWIGLAAVGLLGVLVNPGFLLVGAGAELAYLFSLSGNRRFQNHVRAQRLLEAKDHKQIQLSTLVARLTPEARSRFQGLQRRCLSILDFYANQLTVGPEIVEQHSRSLNNFAWIFLQLLLTREGIVFMIKESSVSREFRSTLERDIRELDARLGDNSLPSDLRKSLESRRDILRQRLNVRSEAEAKLQYIDAELDRIEQQIELLREQAAISKDSQAIATRIDNVSSSLGETSEWIKEQQNLYGAVQEVVEEPPVIVARGRVGTAQAE